jgi:hypothetical protein
MIVAKRRGMTRKQASEELKRKGWEPIPEFYPGIWRRIKDGHTRVWFQALQIEGITFDRKDKPWND